MIAKNIDQITEEDLQTLVGNSVLEGKRIEYKKTLPSNSDSDKKEFLADVSSFANASGGDLIYGISEDMGIPKAVEGLNIINVDQEIRRLDSLIRNGIKPRIPSVFIQPIALSNSKTALVIRVSKSWISPHRVSFKGHDKFYSRSSNGKYPLDVEELRIAFTLSEMFVDKIKKFRENRTSNIYANETPVPFYDNAKTILHLIPIISFSPSQSYDISKIALHPSKMCPIYCTGWDHRYNLDGFLTYSGGAEGKSHSYVQLFRNGIIEAVEGLLLKPQNRDLSIPSLAYEEQLIQSLRDYLDVLQTLSVELPIFLVLTLVGVKGYRMGVDRDRYFVFETHTIDRDVLLLPEVVIESYDVKAKDVLRPSFDSIWNACGYPRSLNYNDSGEWMPR